MRRTGWLIAIAALAAAGTALGQAGTGGPAAQEQGRAQAAGPSARARLADPQGRAVGEATLTQTPQGVLVQVRLDGVPPGGHAFHVHAVGRCAPTFEAAGGHWNPHGRQHGFHGEQGAHAGDLPNVYVPQAGTLRFDAFLPGAALSGGRAALLDDDGAALVLHADPDDYRTDPAGQAGGRIACGVITR